MQRQFKKVALTAGGTPQPVFATTTTEAVGPVGTPTTSLQSVPVTDSSLFQSGDWVVLDPAGTSSSGTPERLKIESIPDGTHIKVQGIQYSHVNGVYVQLAAEAATVTIQGVNSSEIFIGAAGMNKTSGPYLYVLQPVTSPAQPNQYVVNLGDGQNSVAVDDFWFDGTTSDVILPSLTLK